MTDLYRVHWKSLRTGKTGQGDRIMSQAQAQAWADELNARTPNYYLKHWIEPAEPTKYHLPTKESSTP